MFAFWFGIGTGVALGLYYAWWDSKRGKTKTIGGFILRWFAWSFLFSAILLVVIAASLNGTTPD